MTMTGGDHRKVFDIASETAPGCLFSVDFLIATFNNERSLQ